MNSIGSMISPSSTTFVEPSVTLLRSSWSHDASSPSPTLSVRSASATLATSRALGWKECGSAPTGSRLNTSTRSPPTFLTQSATKLVVVTTLSDGGEAGVVLVAGWDTAAVGLGIWVGSPALPVSAVGSDTAAIGLRAWVGSSTLPVSFEHAAATMSRAKVKMTALARAAVKLLAISLICLSNLHSVV